MNPELDCGTGASFRLNQLMTVKIDIFLSMAIMTVVYLNEIQSKSMTLTSYLMLSNLDHLLLVIVPSQEWSLRLLNSTIRLTSVTIRVPLDGRISLCQIPLYPETWTRSNPGEYGFFNVYKVAIFGFPHFFMAVILSCVSFGKRKLGDPRIHNLTTVCNIIKFQWLSHIERLQTCK